MGSAGKVAVYTVLYPASIGYFEEFWRSLAPQLEEGFDAYISLDAVTVDEARALMGDGAGARFLPASPGSTPAEIRVAALAQLTDSYDGIVLVDADDVLLPGRVAAAAAALESVDVYACAMRVVNEALRPIEELVFAPSATQVEALPDSAELFARVNVFGFGNGAYRSEVLARGLDVPSDTLMVDWLVASRAYLAGAAFEFDLEPRMLYRQHGRNSAGVLPPFEAPRIVRDARRVADHHTKLLEGRHETVREVAPFERARRLSEGFAAWLEIDRHAASYAERLAHVKRRPWLWWEHVAALDGQDGTEGMFFPPHYG